MTPASYQQRLHAAVTMYTRGRLPAAEYRALGWMVRGDHGLDTPLLPTACCQALTCWAGGGLTTHFTSARHLAELYSVDRSDIQREAAEWFVRRRGLYAVG